jgi:prepilin-type N-terminal cleavage/methylation domain-containing protein
MVRKQQKGFTIIELVVVIVILGILAAVAFPKFSDVSGGARQAVVNGAKAALQSAAVIQFAKNGGVKQTYAAIQGQTTANDVTFTGNCAGAIITYTGNTETTTVDISEYCSG